VLPLFAQELSTSCVAACVRMILDSYGFQLDESVIRSRCGHTNLGIRLTRLANGLTDLPFNIEYHTDWNIQDIKESLQSGVYVIAAVDLRFIDGINAFHAVVIAKMESSLILVHDPLPPPAQRKINLQTFMQAWESADRECVIFEPRL
jgi:ABC-type bacteriocin/lantibiotic exporter with double-glycine peptidase domain